MTKYHNEYQLVDTSSHFLLVTFPYSKAVLLHIHFIATSPQLSTALADGEHEENETELSFSKLYLFFFVPFVQSPNVVRRSLLSPWSIDYPGRHVVISLKVAV